MAKMNPSRLLGTLAGIVRHTRRTSFQSASLNVDASASFQRISRSDTSPVRHDSETVNCTVWNGINAARITHYVVTSLEELKIKAVRDNLLLYRHQTEPGFPVNVVCAKDGREIKSIEDLRRHVKDGHKLLLIGDNAPAICQTRNLDRAYRICRSFLEQAKLNGREETLEKWQTARPDDLHIMASVPFSPLNEWLGLTYREMFTLQKEALYAISPEMWRDNM